jgi:hypothetical protein
MKKTIMLVSAVIIILPALALASQTKAQNGQATDNSADRAQQGETDVVESSPVTTAVPNQSGQANQVQVQTQQQNAGEESQIQNQTATNLSSGVVMAKGLQQNLLDVAEVIEKPEVKSRLNQMASEQLVNSSLIEEKIAKAQSRTSFARFFIGPDYYALKEVKQIMEQNQIRIRELEMLQLSLEDKAEISALQTCIQNLESVNLMLDNQLQEQTKGFSLFGWFTKWFSDYS